MIQLETPRLRLREWRHDDLVRFADLNADPEVVAHFPSALDRRESDRMASRIREFMVQKGWGLWAVEVRSTGEFIGFTGLSIPRFDAPFMPAVEVGWRLSRAAWGAGYATEAARASLRHGFEHLGLEEIVAMIVPENVRSQSVARKLGMTRDRGADFVHPLVPPDSRPGAREHWLFRLSRSDWLRGTAAPVDHDRHPRT